MNEGLQGETSLRLPTGKPVGVTNPSGGHNDWSYIATRCDRDARACFSAISAAVAFRL